MPTPLTGPDVLDNAVDEADQSQPAIIAAARGVVVGVCEGVLVTEDDMDRVGVADAVSDDESVPVGVPDGVAVSVLVVEGVGVSEADAPAASGDAVSVVVVDGVRDCDAVSVVVIEGVGVGETAIPEILND